MSRSFANSINAYPTNFAHIATRPAIVSIGKNSEQEPAELKNYTDLLLDKAKDLDIKVSLTDLKSEIYSKIDSGKIKTCSEILKCFDNNY